MRRKITRAAAPNAALQQSIEHRRNRAKRETKRARAQQGVQSVEIGLRVIAALAEAAGPTTLRDIAKTAGLSASKTHRYLVSLCRSDVAEQVTTNGRYDLGRRLITFGLAALNRLDEYRLADHALEELVAKTGLAATLVIWGNHGPTLVRRKEPPTAIVVTARVGAVLSTVSSGSGRVFAAFLPPEVVSPIIDAEFASGVRPTHFGKPIGRKAFDDLLRQTARDRLAWIEGDLAAGIDGVCAPVFNHEGKIAMVLTVIGMHGTVDLAPSGQPTMMLRRVADELSWRIGFERTKSVSH
jgi:DNA-binding IclR family transcriptional regulator